VRVRNKPQPQIRTPTSAKRIKNRIAYISGGAARDSQVIGMPAKSAPKPKRIRNYPRTFPIPGFSKRSEAREGVFG
jgi:hypothetical protein